jgi:hypothetical protein
LLFEQFATKQLRDHFIGEALEAQASAQWRQMCAIQHVEWGVRQHRAHFLWQRVEAFHFHFCQGRDLGALGRNQAVRPSGITALLPAPADAQVWHGFLRWCGEARLGVPDLPHDSVKLIATRRGGAQPEDQLMRHGGISGCGRRDESEGFFATLDPAYVGH